MRYAGASIPQHKYLEQERKRRKDLLKMLETPVLMALISCTWRSQIAFYLQSCSLGASSRSWGEQPGAICTHWRVLPCSSFSTAWLRDGITMLSLHFGCNFGKPGSDVILWVERCHFSIRLAASIPKTQRSRMFPRALLHQALLKLAGGSESFGRPRVAQSSVTLAPGSC